MIFFYENNIFSNLLLIILIIILNMSNLNLCGSDKRDRCTFFPLFFFSLSILLKNHADHL